MLHVWRHEEGRDARRGERKRWNGRREREVDERFGEGKEKDRENPQLTVYSCKRGSCFKRNDNSAQMMTVLLCVWH